jgi:hypothetical protein
MSAHVISLSAVRRAQPPRPRVPPPDGTRTLVFVPISVWRSARVGARPAPNARPADRPLQLERLARARLLIGAVPRGPYLVRSTGRGNNQRCSLCGAPIVPAECASRAEGLRPGATGVRLLELHPACLRALQIVSTELGQA